MSELKQYKGMQGVGTPGMKGKSRIKKPKPKGDYQSLLLFELPKSSSLTSSPAFLPYVRTSQNGFVLNAYHRVEVRRGSDYSGRKTVEWGDVTRVGQLAEERSVCPICLETEGGRCVAGECGHAYCLPCILRLLSSLGKDSKCAVCSHPLPLSSLRPYDFLPISRISPGSSPLFRLVRKPKTGLGGLFLCGERCVSGFPDSRFRVFNRITVDLEGVAGYIHDIQSLLASNPEESVRKLALSILSTLESDPISNVYLDLEADPLPDQANYYYFYQAADGQPYFLSDLTDQCLLAEYKRRVEYPSSLSAPVLEVEAVLITVEMLREYRFLRHFGVGERAYFVDLDLEGVVSEGVLGQFSDELAEKSAKRNFKSRKEATALRMAKELREPLAAPVFVGRPAEEL